MATKVRSVRWDAELDRKFVKACKARGVTFQALLEEAVSQYLGLRRRPSDLVPPEEPVAPVTSEFVSDGVVVGEFEDQVAGREMVQSRRKRNPLAPRDRRLGAIRGGTVLRRCRCTFPEGRSLCQRCGLPR